MTGRRYIDSLGDGREVWIDGERVADVTKHPAFAEPIRRIADRYDLPVYFYAAAAARSATCVNWRGASRNRTPA